MRAAVVRRTALAASAVTLALLVTACGGSSDDDAEGADKNSATGSAAPKADGAASDVKALTAAELEKVSLAAADLKGYEVEAMDQKDRPTVDKVTVDKPECLPLAQEISLVKGEGSVATTARTAVQKPDVSAAATDDPEAAVAAAMEAAMDVQSTIVSLASYEDATAADSFAALRKAATACANGFAITGEGETTTYTKVTEVEAVGGEEALGLNVVMDVDGKPSPMPVVFIRQAGTIGTFLTIDMAAMTENASSAELPTEVIAAQAAKLA